MKFLFILKELGLRYCKDVLQVVLILNYVAQILVHCSAEMCNTSK